MSENKLSGQSVVQDLQELRINQEEAVGLSISLTGSDENLSYSSNDPFLLKEGSSSMAQRVSLTQDEERLIREFCVELKKIEAKNKQKLEKNTYNDCKNDKGEGEFLTRTESALKNVKRVVNDYLKKGIRLNSHYDEGTVVDLIFKEIIGILDMNVRVTYQSEMNRITKTCHSLECDEQEEEYDEMSDPGLDEVLKGESLKVMEEIIKKLVNKGGKIRRNLFFYDRMTHLTYDPDFNDILSGQCKKMEYKLRKMACESIVSKSEQVQRCVVEVEIDNGCFYVQYLDSIIEPAKIINNQEIRVCMLKIGGSTVKVEKDKDGKRNYIDVLQGEFEMSLSAEGEKIIIHLCPESTEIKDGRVENKGIKVEINEENKAKFDKLKDKSSLGLNCLLGGKIVAEAIDESLKRNSSLPTKSIDNIKTLDVPSALVKQVSLDQLRKTNEMTLGR